jgi:starch synthase
MKILVASAEALPYWKTGGLADVARSLPDALTALGHDVRIILPGYSFVGSRLRQDGEGPEHDATLLVPWPGGTVRAEVVLHRGAGDSAALTANMPAGVSRAAPAAFVQAPMFFDTDRPYDDVPGDALALGRRFAFFCRSVVAYANHWGADVVHLNDWHTGLVPAYGLVDGLHAATVFAIHNLAYQGNFAPALLHQVGLPPELMRTENGLEFHGHLCFVKGGLALADRLVTVSPTYAAEIQTPAAGNGLDGLLSHRRHLLTGILNGIDTATWDPRTDPLIPRQFSTGCMTGKAECRLALASSAGVNPAGPLLGMVTRLAHQKGIDILLGAMEPLLASGCSMVILGSGDPPLQQALAGAAARMPHRVAACFDFNEELAHLVYAGADLFLMPSRYEPCGLGQMIAQRYGTPPVARRTGGITDTVHDQATGFLFDEAAPHALVDAVQRARTLMGGPEWRALQLRCMQQDHSWGRSAAAYVDAYLLAMAGHRKEGLQRPPGLDQTAVFD